MPASTPGRRDPGPQARRRLPEQRPRRPGRGHRRHRNGARTAGPACPSSASAWATRSWPWPWAPAPTSSSSATAAATSPCARRAPSGSRSPPTTTVSPSTADTPAGRRHGHPRQPQRRLLRGARRRPGGRPSRCSTTPRVQRRPARLRPPLRPLRPADGRHRGGAPCRSVTDIRSILILGSGPITIGQGCEFDYSGVQACKVLRRVGYRVILVNCNPATIMTDPELADATYVEPLHAGHRRDDHRQASGPTPCCPRSAARPGSTWPCELAERGILERVRRRADRRQARVDPHGRGPQALPRRPCRRPACRCRQSSPVPRWPRPRRPRREIGFPVLVRASFTLGGAGGGMAHDAEDLRASSPPTACARAPSTRSWSSARSPAGRSSSSRSCATAPTTSSSSAPSRTSTRWACTPATASPWRRRMTLTDKEYQNLRDLARRVHAGGRRRDRRQQRAVRRRTPRPARPSSSR